MTRVEFERLLGGVFEPVPEDKSRRQNGRWLTFRDDKRDCWCQSLKDKQAAFIAPTWADIAKEMELA